MPDDGLVTEGRQRMQILVFLTDHECSTVSHVVDETQRIIGGLQGPNVEFPAGRWQRGRMAASNEAVKQAEVVMLAALFGSVALFCWLTFGSLRAVLCILVPLAIVAILCNALMATLGIGLKVATLPVMALGVGVESITGSICTSGLPMKWLTVAICARRSTRPCANGVRRRCLRR